MLKTFRGLGWFIIVATHFSPPAEASTLPLQRESFADAIATALGPGISGAGTFAVAYDRRVSRHIGLGWSVSREANGGGLYSVRGLFALVPPDGLIPGIAVTGGLWGQYNNLSLNLPILTPYFGFALHIKPISKFTAHLNLGYSPWPTKNPKGTLFLTEGPLTGFEIGYQVMTGLEWTLGWNGSGEIMGINWCF